MKEKPEISVVISTYNSVDWLRKTLAGYKLQTFRNYEVVIADDGSSRETADFIENVRKEFPVPIQHVWHEDHGFRKTIILNRALLTCNADYVVMSDGDCIPRADFLEVHLKFREEGYFLSGGYFKLPMDISTKITNEDIETQRCFDLEWLRRQGLKSSFKNKKISAGTREAALLNRFTPTNASWNGHNSSGWKKDLLEVNGFDERMQYGGEDRELGERLMNNGLKSKQIRYSAICLHLEHSRGYVNEEALKKNRTIREKTKQQKIIRTPFGIKREESNS